MLKQEYEEKYLYDGPSRELGQYIRQFNPPVQLKEPKCEKWQCLIAHIKFCLKYHRW